MPTHHRLAHANVFLTEAARIDLNAAPKELLVGLLAGFGASPLDVGGYADRIIAWRTKTAAQNVIDTDPENSLYRSAGLSYTPRHAPFTHVSELWLVQGIPPVLIERMLPFVTVFSGKAQVDVIDAAPQVIAALPGMTPEIVQRDRCRARCRHARSQVAARSPGRGGAGGRRGRCRQGVPRRGPRRVRQWAAQRRGSGDFAAR